MLRKLFFGKKSQEDQIKKDFEMLQQHFGQDKLYEKNNRIKITMKYKHLGQEFNRLYVEYDNDGVSFLDGWGKFLCSSKEMLSIDELVTIMSEEGKIALI